jgi:hypothetical protein
MECLTLRVKDIDVERGEITVRRGKARGIVSRCCQTPSSDRSRYTCEVFAFSTAAMLPLVAWSRSRTLTASIPERPASGHGTGFFLRGGAIAARKDLSSGTISTRVWFSEP